jgi:hypothetical protein
LCRSPTETRRRAEVGIVELAPLVINMSDGQELAIAYDIREQGVLIGGRRISGDGPFPPWPSFEMLPFPEPDSGAGLVRGCAALGLLEARRKSSAHARRSPSSVSSSRQRRPPGLRTGPALGSVERRALRWG